MHHFFRPVVMADHAAGERDHDIELITGYYNLDVSYEQAYGCTMAEAAALVASDRESELIELILNKYHQLDDDYDFVL